MTKLLKVVKPLWNLEPGDEFTYDSEAEKYVAGNKYSFDEDNFVFEHNSNYSISKDFAEKLIKDGCLKEYNKLEDKSNKKNEDFVNVFSEIDALLGTYTDQLNNIDEDCSSYPECLKLEKRTVLTNLVKVLNHLKELKK